jgi:hypothetical protein
MSLPVFLFISEMVQIFNSVDEKDKKASCMNSCFKKTVEKCYGWVCRFIQEQGKVHIIMLWMGMSLHPGTGQAI